MRIAGIVALSVCFFAPACAKAGRADDVALGSARPTRRRPAVGHSRRRLRHVAFGESSHDAGLREAGSYQLTVHLGFDDEEMRGAAYDHPNWGAARRQRDFDVLRSVEFRQFLREQGFILSTWRDLGAKR